MRSVWKPDYFSKTVLDYCQGLSKSKSIKIFDKSSLIPEALESQRVLVHNGKKFVSFLIRDVHVGRKFSYFFQFKSTGSKIHISKKGKKKGKKK